MAAKKPTREEEKASKAELWATIMRSILTAANAARKLSVPMIHDKLMEIWRYAEAQWRNNQPA